MSLRTRLFLALSALVAALVVGQWWMMTSLSRELDRELDTVALAVSGSVATFFSFGDGDSGGSGGEGGAGGAAGVRISDEELLARHEERLSRLPDPAELVKQLEGEDGTRAGLHTVVIRRELDRHAEGDPRTKGDPRTDEGRSFEWKVEARQEQDDAMHYSFQSFQHEGDGTDEEGNVRIHIERAPDARFLWLVGPDSQARVPLPEAGLVDKIERFRRNMLLGSGAVLLLGLMLSAAVAHRVSAPLRRLASAAEEVGDGALGTQVDPTAGDREVRATLGAFNRMSSRLAELDARARRLSALRHLGEIGDVARGLAHTLRNPLNALGLSVEELASRAADPAGADPDASAAALASSARRQIQRMDRGIRSFLVLASPHAGPGGRAADPVDVADLARDVALEAIQDGGGPVRVAVRGEGPTPIRGVEAELRAMLQALVVNATEAMAEAAAEPPAEPGADPGAESRDGAVQVKVGPGGGERGVRVEILDRGPGLPQEVRQRLFTPHVSTKANGSGMGLFLAHRLATERYAGTLEVLDREGGGTRVVLELDDRVDPEREDEP